MSTTNPCGLRPSGVLSPHHVDDDSDAVVLIQLVAQHAGSEQCTRREPGRRPGFPQGGAQHFDGAWRSGLLGEGGDHAPLYFAALLRDAGATADIEDRTSILCAEISIAGLTSAAPPLELTTALHHAVRGATRVRIES